MSDTNLSELDVLILCGGRGARLKPHTERMPKALVEVAGKPIIDHVVEGFVQQGVSNFTFCIGYLGAMIKDHFENRPATMTCQFSDLGNDASMLQRMQSGLEHIGDRALIAYCDTYTDLDLATLYEHHKESGALATIVTSKVTNPFGIVTMDGTFDGGLKSVTTFVEKPVFNYFIGSFIIEREAFALADSDMSALKDGDGVVALFQKLIEEKRLAAFSHDGLNISFNTEPERSKAENILSNFYTYRE